MYKALKNFIINGPDQKSPLSGQVPNNAGGFSFELDNWSQLHRFLVLGTVSGTYYVNESQLTAQNLAAVEACIREDGERVVKMIKEVSLSGRAPKNDPALLVLAMVAAQKESTLIKGKNLYVPTKAALEAYAAIPEIARTFTHLSHFVTFIRKGKMRGWGRGFRKAIARWFNNKSIDDLIYQAIKYKSRDGFSQKDVAGLCHAASFLPKADITRRAVFDYLGYSAKLIAPSLVLSSTDEASLARLRAAEALAKVDTEAAAVALIQEHQLPMESVPTHLRGRCLYKAVAADANLGWLIRNLGNLGRSGSLTLNDPEFVQATRVRLTNAENIRRARLHPLSILIALNTYKRGQGQRGSGEWEVVPTIVDALNEAFFASFAHVEPIGKRLLFAIDVSGSMHGTGVCGVENLKAHEAAAALALVAAQVELSFHCMAFDTQAHKLTISARQRVDDVVNSIANAGRGGTDCAVPFHYALENELKVDMFVCFTDSETWAGKQHVVSALSEYRAKSGIRAKAVNVAMTANRVTNFADDPLCLEVVGFDASVPEVIALFAKGL
jgi:60 kDa SS-A/Ro ribonucleoprotein